jgi:hypothetical protein
MKPVPWLRKLAKRGPQHYPLATLAFYGSDDRKATKPVLGAKARADLARRKAPQNAGDA